MKIKLIKTKADYYSALKRVDQLMNARKGSKEGDELDVLITFIQVYEARHFHIEFPDPIDAILHRMDALKLTRKDLEPYLGSRARVSEVLSRKRPLTLNMIRRLNKHLGISVDTLIKENAA